MSTVPRRAAFDDLRVGQLVAVNDEHWAWSGEVAPYGSGTGRPTPPSPSQRHAVDVVDGDGDYLGTLSRNMGRQVLTILRDTPAPPVTVRREDYDALVAALGRQALEKQHWSTHLVTRARALIDNADTDGE